MPSSENGNAAPLLQHNITSNRLNNPSVNDKSVAQESSTSPVQHEAAMQNAPGHASVQPILTTSLAAL